MRGKLNDNDRWKHVDYRHTNLEKTFARVRAEQKAAKAKAELEAAERKAADEAAAAEIKTKVRHIAKKAL